MGNQFRNSKTEEEIGSLAEDENLPEVNEKGRNSPEFLYHDVY